MSKHSSHEYTKKPLSGKVFGRGLLCLAIGVVCVLIGLGIGATYKGPENNHEKSELQRLEAAKLLKEKLANKLLFNGPKPVQHSAKEKAQDHQGVVEKTSEHHEDSKDSHHAGDAHAHDVKSQTDYGMNTRLWANFLVMFLFILSVGAGSLFLVGLEHLVGAKWSTPLRRVTEIFSYMIFPALILGLVIYFGGMNALYDSWVNNPTGDAMIEGKKSYLNKTWFLIRFVIIFVFWGGFYWFFIRNSKAQDSTKDQKFTRLNNKFAPVFIIGFAFTISLLAIDWIMTLSPKWFSTMFGVAYFGGAVTAALAANIYASVKMQENGYLHPQMKNDTFYSIAGLMFGFNCFWAYVSFCQFMLIWYSNLPEETFWFLLRWDGTWFWYTLSMIIFHFVIPFAVLVSRSSKTNLGRLKVMAVWMLVAHYVDLYWQVVPTFSNSPFVGMIEIGFLIISLGLLVMIFANRAKNVNHVPIGDPKLEQGLKFRLH